MIAFCAFSVQAKAAAITIQCHMRGWHVRVLQAKSIAAATKLQATFRCWRARRAYSAVRASVLTMQAGMRGWYVRQQLRRSCAAATCIQVWLLSTKTVQGLLISSLVATSQQGICLMLTTDCHADQKRHACLLLHYLYQQNKQSSHVCMVTEWA